MDKKHSKQLYENHPIMYSGRRKPISKSLMGFGFMCGDGWYYPTARFSDIVEMINIFSIKRGVYIEILEFKEKFGTCRCYFVIEYKLPIWKRIANWLLCPIVKLTKNHLISFGPTDEQMAIGAGLSEVMDILVDRLENECMEVCEDCGTQFYEGNPRVMTKGWINILCKRCAEKEGRDYVLYPDLNKDPFAEEENELGHNNKEECK